MGKQVFLQVKIDSELKAVAMRLAQGEHMSLSAYIRQLILRAVREKASQE